MSRLIGIDLGTTHTVVAALSDSGPRIIDGPDGDSLLPSVVALDDQGTLLVGEPARARLAYRPDAGVRCFKRDMGSDRLFALGDRRLSATELSALVLREAKARAEAELGEPVSRAVITVPAYFAEPQRAATREAGTLAGLHVVRMVNEPTAAAMAYGLADPETERSVVVLDLGGGTFDVTVLEVYDGVVEVVATGGDSRLGGEDITEALVAHFAGQFEAGPAVLRAACEEAKRIVSSSAVALVPLGDGERLTLTQRALDTVCAPFIDRVRGCTLDALRAARMSPTAVDQVVLAGGATRTPALRALVEDVFGCPPVTARDPDRVVALGAAIQAGLIGQHAAVDELVVTDVLSHSLGVETAKEGADRVLDGYFTPVLHRNSTLPLRRVERFWTMHPKQTALRVRVFQGEHRYVRENRLLGVFEVGDIPPLEGEDGTQAVDIAFTHTLDGLLEVEAEVVATGETRALIIEQHAGRLSPSERARAEAALAALKVHPRDLLPNRTLLERALARHTRLDPHDRALLDGPLTAFEDALARQHPEAITEAAATLRRALELLRSTH